MFKGMKNIKKTTVLLIVCLFNFLCAQTAQNQVTVLLTKLLNTSKSKVVLTAGDQLVYSPKEVVCFYKLRKFLPAWCDENGEIAPVALELIESLKLADRDGLNSGDYHQKTILILQSMLNSAKTNQETVKPDLLTNLELLLTDAYLVYGSHLKMGRVNTETINSEWSANRHNTKMETILQNALDSGKVVEVLIGLAPGQKEYKQLKNLLAGYKVLAQKKGWKKISYVSKMQKGDSSKFVLQVKNRLLATGELEQKLSNSPQDFVFGDSLENAVKIFQSCHGLLADGVVGASTLAELNISVENRIVQTVANLERWRWLPKELGQRNIQVNIPDFSLKVEENKKLVMGMKVIVGKALTRTPVFSGNMSYLVLSPYWNLPRKISVNEILPKLKANSSYLKSKEIKVVKGSGKNIQVIDPSEINWHTVTAANFNYFLRQEPGKNNPLGKVKFMFPNRFAVYLHDTQAPEQFQQRNRGMSHGCIRIEKPLDLAIYLLRTDKNWSKENFMKVVEKEIEKKVILPEPISVHILYFTTWVDTLGVIQYRRDLYRKDKLLYSALHEKPPGR